MIPSAAEIVRRRHTVVIVGRLAGIYVALTGALLGAAFLVMLLVVVGTAVSSAILLGPLVGFLLFSALGFAVMFQATRIARLAVPMPGALVCPRCRYAIGAIRDPRCPECGLQLTEEFLGPVATREPSGDFRSRSGSVLLIILRAAGIWGVLSGSILIVRAGIAALSGDIDPTSGDTSVGLLVEGLSDMARAAILLKCQHRIVRWVLRDVPVDRACAPATRNPAPQTPNDPMDPTMRG